MSPTLPPGAPDASPDTASSIPVLIVGGGLVGASLAIALDRAGIACTLLEATPLGALPAVFDQRNLSLAEASLNALDALDVLPRLRVPTGAIARIHISRAGDFGRVLLSAADHGRAAFGRVVVARDFGEALEARLQALPGLTRLRPARFLGLAESVPAADGLRRVRVGTEDGEHVLVTRLLVAADGAESSVRAALGIEANRRDYAQTLFVARLRAERAPDGTAYERLTDHGPTALLPRGDGAFGLIHGVAADQAEAVAALDDAPFLARVQSVFGWRVGRLLETGPRSVYPIVGRVAQALTAPHAVLVGNAAQSLHPIGAQGFNLGLRDALTLAECIAEAQARGGEAAIGDAAMLADYARHRALDRSRTLQFSHGLARATAARLPGLSALRSLGLLALDADPALRAQLVSGAMGYRGDVPALCRPAA